MNLASLVYYGNVPLLNAFICKQFNTCFIHIFICAFQRKQEEASKCELRYFGRSLSYLQSVCN